MKSGMAQRLKWMLILAFAIAQFGVVNGTAALALPTTMIENCSAPIDDCCDPAMLDQCTSCATCVGYIGRPNRALAPANVQIHWAITPMILSPIVQNIDLPPPRYRD